MPITSLVTEVSPALAWHLLASETSICIQSRSRRLCQRLGDLGRCLPLLALELISVLSKRSGHENVPISSLLRGHMVM